MLEFRFDPYIQNEATIGDGISRRIHCKSLPIILFYELNLSCVGPQKRCQKRVILPLRQHT